MPTSAKSKPATKSKAAAAAPSNPAARPLKKGDHLFLVDGSGYIFRAYHALPPLTRKSDGLQVNAVLGFCNMLWKLLAEMKDDKPTHLAVVFDKSEKTFRTDFYPEYKAHRPDAPADLIPQFPLIREAVHAFEIPCLEQAGLRGRRPDRHLCAARQRGQGHHHHRLLRQGPDAARRQWRHHVRHHEGPPYRARRGDREIRRRAGEGNRGTGADRRFIRQRAGRTRHRRQNRGAVDRRIRRSRNAAQARERNQTRQTPAVADRQRRDRAHLEAPGHARPERAARRAGGPARRARARLQKSHRLPEGDGIQHHHPPRRRKERHRRLADRGGCEAFGRRALPCA